MEWGFEGEEPSEEVPEEIARVVEVEADGEGGEDGGRRPRRRRRRGRREDRPEHREQRARAEHPDRAPNGERMPQSDDDTEPSRDLGGEAVDVPAGLGEQPAIGRTGEDQEERRGRRGRRRGRRGGRRGRDREGSRENGGPPAGHDGETAAGEETLEPAAAEPRVDESTREPPERVSTRRRMREIAQRRGRSPKVGMPRQSEPIAFPPWNRGRKLPWSRRSWRKIRPGPLARVGGSAASLAVDAPKTGMGKGRAFPAPFSCAAREPAPSLQANRRLLHVGR